MNRFSKMPIKNIDYIVDYYAILEIDSSKPFDQELQSQYRKLIKSNHPDRFQHAEPQVLSQVTLKFSLVQEGKEILENSETKTKYDQLLEDFKKNKPKLVSKDGIPILDLSNYESIDLDYLLQDQEWDFVEKQEEKFKQLSGYNPTTFDLIKKSFESDPKNQEVKQAYLEQLAHKKAYLDFQEMLSWEKAGVLNFKPPKFNQLEDYTKLIEQKIDKVINQSTQLVEHRLLTIKQQPLLISDGYNPLEEKNTTKAVSIISQKVSDKFLNKTEELKSRALDKQEHVKEMLKLRNYEIKKEVKDSDTLLFLHVNKKVIVCLACAVVEGNADVGMIQDFGDADLNQVDYTLFNQTVIYLEFNPELDIIEQSISFFNDYLNKTL